MTPSGSPLWLKTVLRRLPGVLLGVLILVVAAGGRVLAHSDILLADPLGGTVLTTPPRRVELVFGEAVVPRLAQLRVFDQSGRRVDVGPVHVDASGKQLIVDLRPAIPPGEYSVVVRVVSADDGHVTGGGYVFLVAAAGSQKGASSPLSASGAPGSGLRAQGVPFSPAATLWRFLEVLAGGLLFGWPAFTLIAGGGTGAAPGLLPAAAEARLKRLIRLASAMTVLSAGGALLEGAALALNEPVARLWRDPLVAPFFVSPFAQAQLLVGALALLGGLTWRPRLANRFASLFVGLAIVATHALTGHVPSSTAEPLAGAVIAALHQAGASVWIGGLTVLVAAGPERPTLARRFGPLAIGAAAILALTGFLSARLTLAGVDRLAVTPYGHTVVVKVALFMLALAAGAAAHRAARRGPERRLRRILILETSLLLALLMAAAILAGLPPARTRPGRASPSPRHEGSRAFGTSQVASGNGQGRQT